MYKLKFSIKLLYDLIANFFTRKDVILISEGANWVINEECKNIKHYLESNTPLKAKISVTSSGLRNKVIHFMSENTLITKDGIRNQSLFHSIHPSNKIILSWFHISEDDSHRTKYIPLLNDFVDYVHTASARTKNKLLNFGLQNNKIIIVPLGVDTSIFKPISKDEKKLLREELNLPEDATIIGSFQKDGNGWGKGLEPKLIKGPDVFCDVVEQLAKKCKIHVLLTGPARGYVKRRLEKSNIPYTHKYFNNYSDITAFYQVLDLYLVCSREEGGPKAILEAMATGIPLITTRVGMASDVITNGVNGMISDIEDVNDMVRKALILIEDDDLSNNLKKNALEDIKKFDLLEVEKKMYFIYNKLLNRQITL